MTLRRIATALAAVLTLTTPVVAGTASAPMQVSVQVVARAIVLVDAQPTVEVTQADVARGYVEVRTVLHARTNSRNGYMLQVEKTSGDFARVDLELPGATMNVAAESWLQRPYVPGGEAMPLKARLYLAPGAAPGSHALPISFSASPL